MTWIKTSDRLPKFKESSLNIGESDRVLVTDGKNIAIGCYTFQLGFDKSVSNEKWHLDDDYFVEDDEITHWMPLPELPTENSPKMYSTNENEKADESSESSKIYEILDKIQGCLQHYSNYEESFANNAQFESQVCFHRGRQLLAIDILKTINNIFFESISRKENNVNPM